MPRSGALLVGSLDAAAVEILLDEIPVDDVREYGSCKPRPLIAVIDVISVFPHIEREQRHHPVVRHGRVRVVERSDPKRAPIEHQPRPAAGEMIDRLFLELLKHCVGVAESVVDQVRELAARPLSLCRRQALPEEAVVPDLAYYAGWPKAFSAAPVFREVFEKRPAE